MVEVFNLFKHANYTSYVTSESSSNYGQPQCSRFPNYPRRLQFEFRLVL